MNSSAPCSRAMASFSGPPAAAMTRAPRILPISTAVSPTPPAAPRVLGTSEGASSRRATCASRSTSGGPHSRQQTACIRLLRHLCTFPAEEYRKSSPAVPIASKCVRTAPGLEPLSLPRCARMRQLAIDGPVSLPARAWRRHRGCGLSRLCGGNTDLLADPAQAQILPPRRGGQKRLFFLDLSSVCVKKGGLPYPTPCADTQARSFPWLFFALST